jgi:ribosomal protein S16
MLYKIIKKAKYKIFNKCYLKLRRKGLRIYPIYDLVVVYNSCGVNKGKILGKLGFYNSNYNERVLYFDSTKLYL